MIFEGPVADQPLEFFNSLLPDRGEFRQRAQIEGEDFSIWIKDHQATGHELFEDLHSSPLFQRCHPERSRRIPSHSSALDVVGILRLRMVIHFVNLRIPLRMTDY